MKFFSNAIIALQTLQQARHGLKTQKKKDLTVANIIVLLTSLVFDPFSRLGGNQEPSGFFLSTPASSSESVSLGLGSWCIWSIKKLHISVSWFKINNQWS